MNTPREQQIITMIAEGKSTKMIASELGVSQKTITNHRTNIYRKRGFASIVDVVKYAMRAGLVAALVSLVQAGTLEWDAVEGAARYRVFYAPTNTPDAVVQITNTVATRVQIMLPVGTWWVSIDAVAEEVTDGATNSFAGERSRAILVRQLPRPAPVRATLLLQTAPAPTGPWSDVTNQVLLVDLPDAGFVRGKMEIFR